MVIERMKGEQNKLQIKMKSLENDILSLKKEIEEKDETVQDKVCVFSVAVCVCVCVCVCVIGVMA